MANGFGNRFIYLHVERPREVARPPVPDFNDLGQQLREVLRHSTRRWGAIRWSREAKEWYDKVYPTLSTRREDLIGAMWGRSATHVIRLAVAYFMLDPKAKMLKVRHFEAARALWRYSEASLLNIYGSSTGSRLGDRILAELRAAFPCVISQTEFEQEIFNKNVPGTTMENEISRLVELGYAERWKAPTAGRSRIDIKATPW
jgi:hypothetical protein